MRIFGRIAPPFAGVTMPRGWGLVQRGSDTPYHWRGQSDGRLPGVPAFWITDRPNGRIARSAARIGRETRSLDSGDRCRLVRVRDIARDADGANDRALAIADQNATRYWNHCRILERADRSEEIGLGLGPRIQSPAAESKPHGAMGFSMRHAEAVEARAILTLERLQMAALIQHHHADRLQPVIARMFQCGADDCAG